MDKEPPDQDSAGSRHKECTVCGEVLETEELEKLYAPAPRISTARLWWAAIW
ncbi:MAG: hypothetical protein ACLRX2_12250 [Oscillospiraceae bacterium]